MITALWHRVALKHNQRIAWVLINMFAGDPKRVSLIQCECGKVWKR